MATFSGQLWSTLGRVCSSRASRSILCSVVLLVAVFQSSRARGGFVVGGWSAARADGFAIDGSFAIGIRDPVELAFPGSTFVSTTTLTPEFLSGVDVVLLTTASSFFSIIDPLSPSESSALYQFVLNGGAAILAADGEFEGGVSAVNESLTGSFGVHAGNEIGGIVSAVPTSKTHPIIHGPFGDVTTMGTYVPGWFDDLGPYATAIGKLSPNGQPFLAVIPAHALSPTSGPVVIACDPAPFVPALYGNSEALLLNTFAYIPEPSTLLLATMSGVPLGLFIRRRRRVRATQAQRSSR